MAKKEEKKEAKAHKEGHSAEKEAHAEAKHAVVAEEKEAAKEVAAEPIVEKAHAKKHKASEKKGSKKGSLDWVDLKPNEIGEVIINLANTGNTPAQVGMVLRDQYGIPDARKVLGKTIGDFFAEHNLLHEVPFDLLDLIRKSVKIEGHMKENKKDMTAKRGLQLTVSKIRRLVKYYHESGKLSKDWKYTSERAALLIK